MSDLRYHAAVWTSKSWMSACDRCHCSTPIYWRVGQIAQRTLDWPILCAKCASGFDLVAECEIRAVIGEFTGVIYSMEAYQLYRRLYLRGMTVLSDIIPMYKIRTFASLPILLLFGKIESPSKAWYIM